MSEALGPSMLQVSKTEQGRAALPPKVVQHPAGQFLRVPETFHDGCRTFHTVQPFLHVLTLVPAILFLDQT
jgi:hypothetical protein